MTSFRVVFFLAFAALAPCSDAVMYQYNTVFGAGTGTLAVTDTGTAIPEPANAMVVLGAAAGLLQIRRFSR